MSVNQRMSAPEPPSGAGKPYSVRSIDGVWWLVSPDDRLFFSRGVCCVNPGASWLEYKAQNPGYAAWRHAPDPEAWAAATHDRLASWGFTTIGGWSDTATLKRSARFRMPYLPVLAIGASAGAPWFDMWDPAVIARMDEVAKRQILEVRDDPRLLGYYTDNELGWWSAALFSMTLEQPSTSGQRRRLIGHLRRHYKNNWSLLTKAFEPRGARSFDSLEMRGILRVKPGGDGVIVARRFACLLAERYYDLVRGIIRKYDRRGLILGDRYQSFYYPEVASAARGRVDIVSTNLNADWNDGATTRFYLDTLHSLSGRPVMVGEFYMAANENRSGNRNDASGFPVVPTQKRRAEGFRTTLESLLKTPYVVGADWFQYYDEPTHGRDDGENYNFGLVDINDHPYEEIVAMSASIDGNRLHSQAPAMSEDVTGGVPSAPNEPMAHAGRKTGLIGWDRRRGFVPPSSKNPLADLYLCWDEEGLYLGLQGMDFSEDDYYADRRIPEEDRMEWRIDLPNGKPAIRARLGSGRAPVLHSGGAGAVILDLGDANRGVQVTYAAHLRPALFGKDRFREGDTVRISSDLRTFARAYRTRWVGSYRLIR